MKRELPQWAQDELAQLKEDRDNGDLTLMQYSDLRRGLLRDCERETNLQDMRDAGRIS